MPVRVFLAAANGIHEVVVESATKAEYRQLSDLRSQSGVFLVCFDDQGKEVAYFRREETIGYTLEEELNVVTTVPRPATVKAAPDTE
jgi:hypothetical protein